MPLTAIIIPCFNEEKRLLPTEVHDFLVSNPSFDFIFIDDGSTDNTSAILKGMANQHATQFVTLQLKKNRGKANAVREGFQLAMSGKKYTFIGYWDADFSTGLDELIRMKNIADEQKLDFVFGSRMKKFNAHISRSGFRHLTGRLITTVIDSYFDLGIYDTQCGAKIFSASLAEMITKKPFYTEWLFDVEIFLRIRDLCPDAAGEEIPLKTWTSRKGSKINVLTAPQLLMEVLILIRYYSKKRKFNE